MNNNNNKINNIHDLQRFLKNIEPNLCYTDTEVELNSLDKCCYKVSKLSKTVEFIQVYLKKIIFENFIYKWNCEWTCQQKKYCNQRCGKIHCILRPDEIKKELHDVAYSGNITTLLNSVLTTIHPQIKNNILSYLRIHIVNNSLLTIPDYFEVDDEKRNNSNKYERSNNY